MKRVNMRGIMLTNAPSTQFPNSQNIQSDTEKTSERCGDCTAEETQVRAAPIPSTARGAPADCPQPKCNRSSTAHQGQASGCWTEPAGT